MRDERDIAEVAARQHASGVDLLKVMATGGVTTAGTIPAEAVFSVRELQQVVAAAGGKPVAAHAHGVQGVQAAVEACVHTIEHCSWVDARGSWGCYDAPTVQRMAERGTIVCPTIGRGWATKLGLQAAMSPALQAMHRAGVRLAASTDAGAIPNLPHHLLCDSLPVLQRCAGMTNAETLRAATSVAALACCIEHLTGAVCEGLAADLLVVPGNPLDTLAAVCAPLSVVCRGAVVQPCTRSEGRAAWASNNDNRCACAGR